MNEQQNLRKFLIVVALVVLRATLFGLIIVALFFSFLLVQTLLGGFVDIKMGDLTAIILTFTVLAACFSALVVWLIHNKVNKYYHSLSASTASSDVLEPPSR